MLRGRALTGYAKRQGPSAYENNNMSDTHIDFIQTDHQPADVFVGRAVSPAVDARNDIEAINAWLRARASKSTATFDRYARESKRFLAYLRSRDRELRSVTLEDIQSYEQALMAGQVSRRPMAPAQVDAVFDVLNSMFGLLAAAGYLPRNILVLRQKRGGSGNTRVERFLSNPELEALLAEAGNLIHRTGSEFDEARAARLRFVLVWFLSTGARISETLKSPMNAVYLAQEAGQSQWHWRVTRKGGRRSDLPLRNDAMDALAQYRLHLGLPRFPAPTRDEGYLVWTLRGHSRQPLYRGTISQDLKTFFRQASWRLDDGGLRAHMAQATTHWLRHTAATQLLDSGASMRFVSKLLGHASQAVTSSIYDHADRAAWRAELEKGKPYLISGT